MARTKASASETNRLRIDCGWIIATVPQRPHSMGRVKLEAVSPERGLSYTKARDDGDDETQLEGP